MLRGMLVAALIAGQTVAAVAPAAAATLDPAAQTERAGNGAFAGARMRLQLGGRPRASAGLAIAPMQRLADGSAVGFRTADGVEFGITNRTNRPALSLAGRPVSGQLRVGQDSEEEDEDGGISTLGVAAIVVGAVAVGAAIGFAVLVSSIDGEDE